MPLNQMHGSQIQDGSLTRRDLAQLPLKSITRDPSTGRVSEIVCEGIVDGRTLTETESIQRDAQGRVSSITFTSTVDGTQTVTRTETFARDAEGRVTGSTLS